MNLVKSITNSIYQSFRRDFLNEMQMRLDKIANESAGDINRFKSSASSEMKQLSKDFSDRAEAGISHGFSGYKILSWLAFFYSIIILIKTYLIVLARVLFVPESAYKASIEDGSISSKHGEMNLASSHGEMIFPANDKQTYYISRKVEVINCPVGTRRPKPFAAFFTRFVNRAWKLNMMDLEKRRVQAKLAVSPPSTLVKWKLKNNERVIFNFASFAGMSSNLNFDRIVTLSVSGLAFGRIIYYCAKGPGTLILKTNNRAIVSSSRNASLSYIPNSYVAWDTRGKFKIDSHLNVNDTFRSGIHLQKSVGDNVIIDTENSDSTNISTGIFNYIKSFLLPI